VRELIKRTDFVFAMMIETMLDVRRAIFDAGNLRRVLQAASGGATVGSARSDLPAIDDRPGVGPAAALSFKVAVDDPLRFIRSRTAASLLLHVRKWSALRAWGLRIAQRSRMLCAIVAVAQARRHPASHWGRR
jgi:transposase